MKKIIMVAGVLALFSGVASADVCPLTFTVTIDGNKNITQHDTVPPNFYMSNVQPIGWSAGPITLGLESVNFNQPAMAGIAPNSEPNFVDCSYSPGSGIAGYVDLVSTKAVTVSGSCWQASGPGKMAVIGMNGCTVDQAMYTFVS